ncbi:MAG: HD domain-containing protein [Candidatus Peribacteraceae bacterium]|nr:HD domain-containing protein [Candidatus Peribacteraceae bacterium]MDD5739859.1 HD domain-containing protein [Candidatus Peribacteraceae bacterium]
MRPPMELATTAELTAVLSRLAIDGKAPKLDERRLLRALSLAQDLYGHRMHHSGVRILDHAFETLGALAPFHPDEDSIIAVLLHHALDEGALSLTRLQEEFGPTVRSLVSNVHLLSHVTLRARRSRIEDLRIMLLSVSDDVRTVLITLCDRAAILRLLDAIPQEERRTVCQDVLQLFAPVAARLGIYSLKHELENHAFPVMYPLDAERIKEQIWQFDEEKGHFLPEAAEELRGFFRARGMEAEIEWRSKEIYSIFLKMQEKAITHIRDLFDLYALRVIVESEAECYQVLGLLHQLGRPVPHRFKDYIAFPKPNGYQSLHTTILQLPGAPPDAFVEVQIRTHAMHRESQYGVAAHWAYKEGVTAEAIQNARLKKMLLSQESVAGTRVHPYADHIFVLTPKGEIVELPEGATPLDFAFTVHTDLGLAFSAARVNGSIVPLSYNLENGDVVEIQKQSPPHPSTRWMQLLKMASSRAKLKRYLAALDRPRFVDCGRKMLNEELRKHHRSPLDTDLTLLKICDGEVLTVQQREDLLMKIGQGAEKPSSFFRRLEALRDIVVEEEQRKKRTGRLQRKDNEIAVEGSVPMPTRYAKCCSPEAEPRAKIGGVINRLGTVMVHREKCKMFRQANPERRIGVKWR